MAIELHVGKTDMDRRGERVTLSSCSPSISRDVLHEHAGRSELHREQRVSSGIPSRC